jgi:hypothetical protein
MMKFSLLLKNGCSIVGVNALAYVYKILHIEIFLGTVLWFAIFIIVAGILPQGRKQIRTAMRALRNLLLRNVVSVVG